MVSSIYKINYSYLGDIELKSKASMKKYLAKEQAAWAGFFEHFNDSDKREVGFPTIHKDTKKIEQISNELHLLSTSLDKPEEFNRFTFGPINNLTPPPPSNTMEGKLILQLFAQGRFDQSFAVFLNVYIKNKQFRRNETGDLFTRYSEMGAAILDSIYASEALPADRLLTQKIDSTVRRVSADADVLSEQIDEARTLRAGFAEDLDGYRMKLKQELENFRSKFVDAEAERGESHSSAEKKRAETGNTSLNDAKSKATQLLEKLEKDAEEALGGIEATHKRYFEKLRYDAPVKLWKERADAHKTHSDDARKIFWGLIIFATLIAVGVPLILGDFIASSFYDDLCHAMNSAACNRVFSVKGPLLVSGLLFFSSILLWIIRMQYRVFLSERHLSIDASEKKAFAETYLALREDQTVSEGNEAIVLASLFRPTQDGIVKDDESMVDISAASIIAKQLGK
ncbi:MAG: hypothetical protein KUG74_15445 [Rhodobacteraceae bacterium]|nr:hypothetical protein [Paracoccaceae bacterium]